VTALLVSTAAMVLVACTTPDLEPPAKTGEVHGSSRCRPAARSWSELLAIPTWQPHSNGHDSSTVAVDPSVIPLGSRLRIEGYPDMTFIAEDTGGGVRGNHVDIFFEDYRHPRCVSGCRAHRHGAVVTWSKDLTGG
jgi:hypothetical protein